MLRLALCGPSGSGKSHSALLIASGLTSGNIFVIDTEKGSALLEQGKPNIPPFSHAELSQPFSPARYCEYINTAVQEGADCIIIDSLSHAWSGVGGILDKHDKATLADRTHNTWAAWREVTPEHNRLVNTLLQCDVHLIITMRTKTSWQVVEDERGKKKPIKIGMKPEQKEGLEYEFTVVLDLSVEKHIATCSKDRTSLFDGNHFIPSQETGLELMDWLDQGIDPTTLSAEKMKALKKEVDTLAQVSNLENWYRTHRHEFNLLTPKDLDEMMGHCGQKKQALISGDNGRSSPQQQ